MRKIYFLPFLLFGLTIASLAQKGTLKGTVTDQKGEPIFSASVVIDVNAGLAVNTDFDGNYKLLLDPGKYTVKFSSTGKSEFSQTFEIAAGAVKEINVKLEDKEEVMDVVVVSASKYAKKLSEETISIEVMKTEQLQNQNVKDMEDGIKRVPGVTVVEGQANIRGGSGWSYGAGSRVMVLVDDLPLLTADAQDAKWTVVPLENMEQVEVLKGAASALYGSSALNGIINMRSAWPGTEPYTRFISYGGVFESPNNKNIAWWRRPSITLPDSSVREFNKEVPFFTGINFGHRRRIGRFDLVLGGAYQAEKSYLIGNSSQFYRLNAKTRYRFGGKAEGLSIGVNVNFYNSFGTTYFLWYGADSLAYLPMPGTTTNYISYRATVDPHLTYVDKYENKYSFRGRFFNATNTNDTKQGSVPNLYFGELQYQRFFRGPRIGLVAGLAGYYSTVKSPSGKPEESLIGNHFGYNISAYAQADIKLFNRLTLAFGTRYEYFVIDSFQSKYRPVFRAGINIQAHKATYIRASFGEGYRFPTMAEKFVRTNVGTIGIYPNPNLTPETGWSAELGIKQGYKFGKGNWMGYVDLSGFINQYKNMMEFTFGRVGDLINDPLFGLGFSAQNVGNTRIIGGEIVYTLTGKIKGNPITLLAGYTYIDPRYTNWEDTILVYNKEGNVVSTSRVPYKQTVSSDKNILKYRNRHSLKFDIEATLFKKFTIGTNIQFNSYMENIDKFFVDEKAGAVLFEEIGLLDTYTFRALKEYRDNYKRLGDTQWDIRASYLFKNQFKLAFLVKNVLNQFYMNRPGFVDPPRNYTLQLTIDL